MFSPGLCHRLSSYPASDRDITLVVYLSLCLSSSNGISFDTTPSEGVNSSYWCWMSLDINKALSRNRESLRVLRVEPLFQPSWGNNAELWPHNSNLNMLPKIKRPDVSVLDFIPSQVIQKPGCLDDSSESRKKYKKALGGIWWIAHQTNAENTDLDSNYFVRWTEIQNPDYDTKNRRGTISAFPPGVNLLEPVPSWYRHPTYLTQSLDDSPTDNLWDESSVDVQLHIFLDQLFHPGCLSWFAIANAFKSICESYSLLDCDSVFTVSNLHEMRVFIHRTLMDKLIPNLDHAGFKTMLNTFYATAIDYHEHGLQPLGLLRLSTTDTTTSSGSSTSGKMFPSEDDTIIVIRRWGFSILRHLQDVEILLWNNIPPIIDRIQSPHLDTKVNTQNVVDLTTDCRKILHILQAQPKWPHWKANLFGRTKSNLNISPLVLVEQIIEELDQINECWLPPPIISSVKFKSPFCTGSLSNSHLTAVIYLLSLLDNCDIMNKSVQSLQSLFDMDTNSTYEDMEITNQSWYNNSRSIGERTRMVGNAAKQFVGDINNNNQDHRTWQLLFSSPDLINTNDDGELWQSQNVDNDTLDYDDDSNNNDGSSGRISWWWEKDFSFVHLCIGLAKLWSGESGSAKKHFITASNWLYCYTQSFMNYLTESSIHHSNSTTNQNVPKLLIPILFPKEFSLSKLFCLSESIVNGDGNSRNTNGLSLSPIEVQIRFLMKLMSIFEVSNYVPEILDLAEFCLNRLAETQNSIKSENCLNQNSGGRSTHRLASVLASLRGIMENDNLSGFLCGSVKKHPDFIENECSVKDNDPQSRINTRLADLEATLWTRMFKHELVLGNYTKAYMILQSNPDIARRRDCLRQLIVTVCDRGEASKLISFQYGPMENEFIAILEARARAADVVIVPDPSTKKSVPSSPAGSNPYYDVLYAYHIHRADYRAAASVMFEHSYRLIEDTMLAASRLNNFRSGGARILIGLQRQAACLASAINTLYLVPKDNQWLDPNDDWAFANPDDLALDNIIDEKHTGDQHRFEDNSLDQEQPIPSAKRNATIDPSSQQLGKDKRILTLKDLLNAYILTRARLRLAQACWEQGMLRAGVFTPDEVVRGLLSVALYDEAVRLCESYDLDPALIINSISLRCSELAQCATGSVNLVNFSQPTVNYELRRKEVYDIHRTTSIITSTGLNQFPVLPGLANDSSPLEHEADLVQQSLSNLATLSFDKVGNDGDNIGAIEKSSSLKIVPYHSNYNYSSRCSLPELYWRLLETVLTRLDPPSKINEKKTTFQTKYHGLLHLIACENILASGPNQLYLPEWLTSRLLSTSYATERAVNLLRLYIKFNRLETAYRLAMVMLEAAMNNGADPSSFGLRSTLSNSMDPTNPIRKTNKTMMMSGTMYLPHTLFVYILNALKLLSPESKTCEAMHDNLESALRNYFVKLQSICRGLIVH
ncbi:hypothetical protein Smp_194730 [Schistosoma mansoni]|uniref:hypothetical protein n=1 Tax=Schistosoma mansoni TaxID=6183 RepID=UPI0001A626ED|nr:hypothetical protein Smp_194730 [Schistosoma mansoni]|eukprot:XP_018650670.1 hypothetical protein Smp_194730 [Schistosoma mansoni]